MDNIMSEDTKMKKHVTVVVPCMWVRDTGLICALAILQSTLAKGFVRKYQAWCSVFQYQPPLLIGVIATLRLIGGIGLFYRPGQGCWLLLFSCSGLPEYSIGITGSLFTGSSSDETIKLFRLKKLSDQ